jgi:hypothetical protein
MESELLKSIKKYDQAMCIARELNNYNSSSIDMWCQSQIRLNPKLASKLIMTDQHKLRDIRITVNKTDCYNTSYYLRFEHEDISSLISISYDYNSAYPVTSNYRALHEFILKKTKEER